MIHSLVSNLLVAGGFFLLAVWWQRGGKSLQQSQAQEGWLSATTSRGVDGRREKEKKIEGCKDVKLLGKDTN